MIELDLLYLADRFKPKEIVKEIFDQNPQLSGRVPLEEIAEAVGIREIRYHSLDGIEGALLANPEKTKGIVVIDDGSRYHRQRFTLGHELGHFLIPKHGHEMSCASADLNANIHKGINSEKRIEAEANQFSAELLMPIHLFTTTPQFRSEPSIVAIDQISRYFDVSFQTCANRYIDLQTDPVAVVFSHYGNVKYSKRGKGIPFWLKVNKGDSVPSQSFTKKVDAKCSELNCSDECDSSVWFEEAKDFELPEFVIEDVLVQDKGYMVTLLWFNCVILDKE
ncbi:MAG: ImmA/IrrE family metallo-endopeptidase [Neptuniibacter sp.]